MTRRTRLLWAALPLAIFAMGAAGCSKGPSDPNRLKVVPASGVVTYQGKPVEGAEVTFNNEAAKITAYAKTDSSGRFVLTTYEGNDGAAPGQHSVSIRRVDVIDKTPAGVDVSAGGPSVPPEIRWIIPEKYSIPAKSGLKQTVTESGPNEFTFDLK